MICPYSNATHKNIDIKLSVTPVDGNHYDVTAEIDGEMGLTNGDGQGALSNHLTVSRG